ncbi:cobalamin biosynthesis protein [Pseudonocardia spinosispora]|uniref:cobalamin biosynthesis protein n=1 Tax=Pseudonocardia spinosispora TaxID=103441 RepID=UPI000400954F|nr:cobalamin biosynthesis protein [Pseudonocardia spinosispora]
MRPGGLLSSRRTRRATGLLLGFAADALLGDPARWHPVAGFGVASSRLERRCYADSYAAGAGYTALTAGTVVVAGAALSRLVRHRPVLDTLTVAAATWVVLGGASLAGEGIALADSLDSADIPAARARIPHLCARDPESLDADGMARAGCESIAENTSDAVVAPLFWGAVAGLPGLLGYRAINTLDAMVGYRSARYSRFGWSAARTDDLVNLAPARLTAALTVGLAPLVGGSPSAALRAWRHDSGGHPSPNAGPVEASAAGALGITLGGTTRYAYGVEERPRLGTGRSPVPADLRRTVRLSRLLGLASALIAAGAAWALPQKRALP